MTVLIEVNDVFLPLSLPFPRVMQTYFGSCPSPLLPAASHCQGPTTTTRAPAAHPRGNWCTALSRQAAHSLGVGGETGNTAPRQEGGQTRESESNKSYTLFPLPFASVVPEVQPAALTLVPSCSDSLPSPPLLAFIQLASSGQICQHDGCLSMFCFHLFFPFLTREVSHSQP